MDREELTLPNIYNIIAIIAMGKRLKQAIRAGSKVTHIVIIIIDIITVISSS